MIPFSYGKYIGSYMRNLTNKKNWLCYYRAYSKAMLSNDIGISLAESSMIILSPKTKH